MRIMSINNQQQNPKNQPRFGILKPFTPAVVKYIENHPDGAEIKVLAEQIKNAGGHIYDIITGFDKNRVFAVGLVERITGKPLSSSVCHSTTTPIIMLKKAASGADELEHLHAAGI